jgi:hypothetical protein
VSFVRLVSLLWKELVHADLLERQLRRRSGARSLEAWCCDSELRERHIDTDTHANANANANANAEHRQVDGTDVRQPNVVRFADGNQASKSGELRFAKRQSRSSDPGGQLLDASDGRVCRQ